MIELYNMDNMLYETDRKFDIIYSDMIYENHCLDFIDKYWNFLKDDGLYIVQTDWHTDYKVRYHFEREMGWVTPFPVFVNHLVVKGEWGNHPSRKMHQCYDSVIIYAKNKKYKFYPEKIQIPKATKTKGLNPSGRETKTATAWVDDICLTTTSKERVKKADGHLIRWQKDTRLFSRIITPFTDDGDWILDNFMGSGSVEEYAIKNNRNCIGIEYDKEIFDLAKERLEKLNG